MVIFSLLLFFLQQTLALLLGKLLSILSYMNPSTGGFENTKAPIKKN